MKVFARIISALGHPLLAVTWLFMLMVYLNKYAFGGIDTFKLGLMMFINTFFFPAFAIFLMWRLEFIPSLKMPDKKDRIAPFFAIIICYVWAFLVVKKSDAFIPGFLQSFVLGAAISAVMSFIINIFYRLNLHMVGAGAIIMFLFLFSMLGHGEMVNRIIPYIVAITGFIGTARMYLEQSNLSELYFGLLVGFMGQMIAYIALSSGGISII